MKPLRIVGSYLLAFLVLFSSTSFVVGIHLCQGHVENVALFKKADVCEREMKMPPCHRQMMASCCDDEQVYHEGQGFKQALNSFDFASTFAVIVQSPAIVLDEIFNVKAALHTAFIQYDPPLRTHDRVLSLQVFLI